MPTKNRENGVHLPFEDLDFVNKWQEWLQYRKERRLPNYVPTGLKKTFSHIITDSGNDPKIAAQMLEQSMAKGWQGIFPLKTAKNGKSTVSDDKLKKTIAAHIGGW